MNLPIEGAGQDVWYSFFIDSDRMRPNNNLHALTCFEYCHNSIINLIKQETYLNNLISPLLIKHYFKFRHNIFVALYLNTINVYRDLGTDDRFPEFVHSNKTPDYVHLEHTFCKIREFAVNTSFEVGDFNKGGFYKKMKYYEEQKILESHGLIVDYKNIILSLTQDDITEILADIEPSQHSDLGLNLTKFRSICNHESRYIYDNIDTPTISNMNQTLITRSQKVLDQIDIQSTNYFPYKLKKVFLRQSYIPTNIILSKFLVTLRHSTERFFIIFNEKLGIFELKKNVKGYQSMDLYKTLQTGDPAMIMPLIYLNNTDCKAVSTVQKPGMKEVMVFDDSFLKDFFASAPSLNLKGPIKAKAKKLKQKFQTGYNKTFPEFPGDYFECFSDPGKVSLSDKCFMFNINYLSDLMEVDYDGLIKRDYDTKKSMLCNNSVNAKMIESSIISFNDEYIRSNVNYLRKYKQTFTYPVITGRLEKTSSYTLDGQHAMNVLQHANLGEYTKAVIMAAASGNYSESKSMDFLDTKTDVLKKKYNECNSHLRKVLKECYKDNKRIPKCAQVLQDHPALKSLYDKLASARADYLGYLNELARTGIKKLVKIKCKGNSVMRRHFNSEMTHFKHSPGTFQGVGNSAEIGKIDDLFRIFMRMLNNKSGSDFYCKHETSNFDHPLFKKLKRYYLKMYDDNETNFSTSLCAQILELIFYFCKTLFYASTRSFSGDYVLVDNLGFGNIILLIKGGKKIQSTGMSKLYRFIYPVNIATMNISGALDNDDYKIFQINNQSYIATPWSQMREGPLLDGITLKYRFRNHYNSMITRCNGACIEKNSLYLPLLLALSNRRKTEEFMHNLRYLIVNNFGKYSSIPGIITSFAGFNYTLLDVFLRENILKNYANFSESLQKMVKDPSRTLTKVLSEEPLLNFLTGDRIEFPDELTSMIYSTYLMTKAPYDKSIEQANNLLPILEDVSLFKPFEACNSFDDTPLRHDLRSIKELPPTDFSYDPTYMQYLGYRCGERLAETIGSARMSTHWKRVYSQNLINIANPNGLRGYNKGNFFSKKGYEIVATYIFDKIKHLNLGDILKRLDDDPECDINEIAEIDLLSDIDFDNISLKFHVVDKTQRSGGREIMVMDIYTKIIQNPIEKMFKLLCKGMDNEMISMPSGKRPDFIHKKFFEKDDNHDKSQIYNFVLDCKRWAPHSVLQKYIHFIYGMKHNLPKTFYTCVIAYLDLMINNKVFITRDYAIKHLKENKRFSNLEIAMLKSQYAHDDWSFVVKFSFVMGISNYMSSLVHAENQKLASEIIFFKFAKESGIKVDLRMIAHSDDSAGKLFTNNDESVLYKTVGMYEILLKSANHMLSVKKSVISPIYFEFLSVLYLFKSLLPVTTKFLCGLTFTPTDKGLGSDLTFAASQAIELMQNGGNMFECYLAMKNAISTVNDYYGLFKPIDGIHFSAGGLFDPHPITLLMSGTDSEFIRLTLYSGELFTNSLKVLNEIGLIDIETEGDTAIRWDMGYRLDYSLMEKFSELNCGLSDTWLISNYKFKQTFMSLLWFSSKLKDKNFYSSLINLPPASKISRLFGSSRNRNLITKDGCLYSFSDILNHLRNELTLGEMADSCSKSPDNITHVIMASNDNLVNLYSSLPEDFEIHDSVYHTIKPITIDVKDNNISHLKYVDPISYVVFKKENKYFPLIVENKDRTRYFKYMDKIIMDMGFDADSLSANELYKLVRKILPRGDRSIRLIQNISSSKRHIKDYTGVLSVLSEIALPGKNLVLNFRNSLNVDNLTLSRRLRIPEVMTNALEMKWLLELKNLYSVPDSIFNIDLASALSSAVMSIPNPWRMVFDNYIGIELQKIPCWRIWTRPQTKLGNNYKGKGTLVFKIIEATFEIKVDDDIITYIGVRIDDELLSNTFVALSNWYLIYFIDPLINLKCLLESTEGVDSAVKVLGVTDSGDWGYSYPSNFEYYIPGCRILSYFKTDSYSATVLKKTVGFDGYEVDSLRVFVMDIEANNKYIDGAKYLNRTNMLTMVNLNSVRKLLNRVMRVDFPLTISTESLVSDFASSITYKMIHNCSDFEDFPNVSLLNALIMYREIDEEFGFPSGKELAELYGSGLTSLNASDALRVIKEQGYVSDYLLRKLIDGCESLLKGKVPFKEYLSTINSVFGSRITGQVLSIRKKSKLFLTNFKMVGNRNTVIGMLKDYVDLMLLALEGKQSSLLNKLNEGSAVKYNITSLFSSLTAITVVDIINTKKLDPTELNSWSMYVEFLQEVLDSSVMRNIQSYQDDFMYFSLIDLDCDVNEFIDFVIDILSEVKLTKNYFRDVDVIPTTDNRANEGYLSQYISISGIASVDFKRSYERMNFTFNEEIVSASGRWCGASYGLFIEEGKMSEEAVDEYMGSYEDVIDIEDGLTAFDSIIDLGFMYLNGESIDDLVPLRAFANDVVVFSRCSYLNCEYENNIKVLLNPCIMDTTNPNRKREQSLNHKLIQMSTTFYTTSEELEGELISYEDMNMPISYSTDITLDGVVMDRFSSDRFLSKDPYDINRMLNDTQCIDPQKIYLSIIVPEFKSIEMSKEEDEVKRILSDCLIGEITVEDDFPEESEPKSFDLMKVFVDMFNKHFKETHEAEGGFLKYLDKSLGPAEDRNVDSLRELALEIFSEQTMIDTNLITDMRLLTEEAAMARGLFSLILKGENVVTKEVKLTNKHYLGLLYGEIEKCHDSNKRENLKAFHFFLSYLNEIAIVKKSSNSQYNDVIASLTAHISENISHEEEVNTSRVPPRQTCLNYKLNA